MLKISSIKVINRDFWWYAWIYLLETIAKLLNEKTLFASLLAEPSDKIIIFG